MSLAHIGSSSSCLPCECVQSRKNIAVATSSRLSLHEDAASVSNDLSSSSESTPAQTHRSLHLMAFELQHSLPRNAGNDDHRTTSGSRQRSGPAASSFFCGVCLSLDAGTSGRETQLAKDQHTVFCAQLMTGLLAMTNMESEHCRMMLR